MRLLEVKTGAGTSRACTAACYDADPSTKDACTCICGGRLHGIGAAAAGALTPEELDVLRAEVPLGEHEHVQMRFGA